MSSWLKKGKENKLVIVGFEQSFGHYHGVSMKLGVNLLKLRQSGQVVFYDGLKQIPSLLEQNLEELKFVNSLYEDIAKLVTENTLIVIDQVAILSSLGLSVRSTYSTLVGIDVNAWSNIVFDRGLWRNAINRV